MPVLAGRLVVSSKQTQVFSDVMLFIVKVHKESIVQTTTQLYQLDQTGIYSYVY